MAQALARLLRISLAPSAFADVVAGSCAGLAAGGSFRAGTLALGAAASLCVYHAGMALNDFADRRIDARARPDRPIPSGAFPPRLALAIGLAGLAASVLLAACAGPEVLRVAGTLSLLVLAYDFAAKRSAWTGPPILGACRALNLLLGAACSAPPSYGAALLLPAAAYGLYVFLVSHLARMEDTVVRAGAARILALAAPSSLLLPALSLRSLEGAVAAAAFAALLARPLVRIRDWTRGAVERVVGRLLGGTILLDASIAVASGYLAPALGLLLLYPLARALARRYPPT
ncbi:MAG: UbiA family prenyltransferase [Planctomycetes bacterium]|nr:UbiA family prenyltransferase [Planctomycetota bacterium]